MALRNALGDLALDATAQEAADHLAEIKAQLDGTLNVQTEEDLAARGGRAIEVNVGVSTSVGQPVNGKTQLFIGPPAGKLWRVRSLRSIYTCDGTIATRVLVASFTSVAVGDTWSMSAGEVAQANNVIEISGDDGGSPGQVNVGQAEGGEGLMSVVNVGWPDIWIPADLTLRIWVFSGNGVNDTFSDANAFIEERDA